MTENDPLFPEIENPDARKRALGDKVIETVDEIIFMTNVPFPELQNKLNFLKRLREEMKALG